MMFADFEYYQTVFYGNQITDELEYNRLATRAAMELNYYTLGRAEKHADLEAVKMASCAVAEQYQIIVKSQATAASEVGELQSETVGSYSRSYRSSAEYAASASGQIAAVINKYLASTGLLSRGVPVCTHRMW